MRLLFTLPLPLLFVGCLESREGQRVPEPATLRIDVETTTADIVRTICFSVVVSPDEPAAAPSIHGDPSRLFDTVAEAEQAGAICGERLDPDTDLTLVASLTVPCEVGDGTVVVSPAGAFYEDGLRLDEADVQSDTYPRGSLSFTCAALTETPVSFDFLLMVQARQGFFDIGVNGAPPAGAETVCYAVRVLNGEGLVVWANPALCSNEYGDHDGGNVTYVGPCDSRAPEHVVTVWTTAAYGPDGELLPDAPGPCNDGRLEGDASTWTGGCATEATCLEYDDVSVDFDLPALSGRTP